MVSSYPVQFDVDFPERKLDRLRTALRLIAAIPIVIVLSLLSGPTLNDDNRNTLVIGGATVFLPLVLMLVFRQKYPRWWFDWNLNLLRFSTTAIRQPMTSRPFTSTSRIPTPTR